MLDHGTHYGIREGTEPRAVYDPTHNFLLAGAQRRLGCVHAGFRVLVSTVCGKTLHPKAFKKSRTEKLQVEAFRALDPASL